jgi:hypothetical protein
MPQRGGRCPSCGRQYTWGATVCPACHVGLDLSQSPTSASPEVAVFETGDRPSADIVAGLLSVHDLPCVIRGTDDALHAGLGRTGYWRVWVRAADEASAQAILDAEIGREAED